jgi:hypothetical protein
MEVFMAHLFKKAGLVLATFVGIQAFGGEQANRSWFSYLFSPKEAKISDYALSRQVAALPEKERKNLIRGVKAYEKKQEQEKQLKKQYRKAGAYTAAGLGAMLYSDTMLDTLAAGRLAGAKKLLYGAGRYGGAAVAGAGGLVLSALAVKYYNNNVLTPERVEAFKERTSPLDYYNLGSSY